MILSLWPLPVCRMKTIFLYLRITIILTDPCQLLIQKMECSIIQPISILVMEIIMMNIINRHQTMSKMQVSLMVILRLTGVLRNLMNKVTPWIGKVIIQVVFLSLIWSTTKDYFPNLEAMY